MIQSHRPCTQNNAHRRWFAIALAWIPPRTYGVPGILIPASIVLILGVSTWRQSQMYRDPETLYRETISRNTSHTW